MHQAEGNPQQNETDGDGGVKGSMQKTLSAAVLAGPLANVGGDPPSMMAAMGIARDKHRPGTLMDCGATHRITWVDAEDTNAKFHDELHMAVGSVPCKTGVGDKGSSRGHRAKTGQPGGDWRSASVLPGSTRLCFHLDNQGPISGRLETSGSTRQSWNTCRC